MHSSLAEFLNRVRTCEGMNESLSLERFSTFLRGLRELDGVIADTRRQLGGHVAPPVLDALEEEVTQFIDRWEFKWNQFLAAPHPPFRPILYFEEFPDWKPLQHDIERLVGRCRELMATISRTAAVPFDSSRLMDIRKRFGTVLRMPPVEVPETVPDEEEEP